MSTVFADIRTALEETLKTLGLPVAWENVEEPSDLDVPYVAPTLIPGNTEAAGMGSEGKDRSLGIFQVDVYLPAGQSPVSTIPDQIGDAFKRGSIHSHNGINVRVRRVAQVAGRRAGAWWIVPVDVTYFTYTNPRSA